MSRKDGVKKKRKIKKAPVIAGAIVLLVITGVLLKSRNGSRPTMVTTTNAFRGELQESISTTGVLAAEETKTYFAPVDGKIAEIQVVPGMAVKRGELLISYDAEELERAFRQATLQQDKFVASYNGVMAGSTQNQAKLKEANTNLAVLEQQITDNKAYLKDLQEQFSQNQREASNSLAGESFRLNQRYSTLQEEIGTLDPATPGYEEEYAGKVKELKEVQSQITRNNYLQQIANSTDYVVRMEKEINEVQERIAGYEEYKARMESQKAGSEAGVLDSYAEFQYEADLELADMSFAEAEADYYTGKAGICADFDGIVTEVAAVEGSTVMEGTQLLKLESSKDVKVDFSASKWDLEKLAVGQKAEITIFDNVYNGTVNRIDRMASAMMANAPMVGAQIHIDDPDDKIILGLDAKITIYTNFSENALLIPVEAVNADKEGDFLYVVENGIAVRKPIVCGISNNTYTEVLEGLTEQDEIILTAVGNLEENMAVAVTTER